MNSWLFGHAEVCAAIKEGTGVGVQDQDLFGSLSIRAGSALFSCTSNSYLLPAGSALPRPKGNIGPAWLVRATKPGHKANRYLWHIRRDVRWYLREHNIYLGAQEAN